MRLAALLAVLLVGCSSASAVGPRAYAPYSGSFQSFGVLASPGSCGLRLSVGGSPLSNGDGLGRDSIPVLSSPGRVEGSSPFQSTTPSSSPYPAAWCRPSSEGTSPASATPSPSANPLLTKPKLAVKPRPLRYLRSINPQIGMQIAGSATWQPLPGLYGSAGPVLRAMGVKAGQTVRVCSRGNCVTVTIWPGGCWCRPRPGGPTLIDLSNEAFARLAPLSQGVLSITVRW